MKSKIGFFIGHFQPFHLKHMDIINQAKKKGIKTFIIGIKSSDKKYTAHNPFTYQERKIMITKIFEPLGIRFDIYPLPDFDNHRNLRNYIDKNIPDFDIIISDNLSKISLFKKMKYQTLLIKTKKNISSRTIRNLLCLENFEEVQKMLPIEIFSYLQKINASKRLKKYYQNECVGPLLAVDGIVITKDKKIVIIKRKYPPLGYALPGGFVKYGETPEQALIREMKEEIGVYVKIKKLAGIMSDPKRDIRGHIISLVYIATIINGTLKAGDDAKAIKTIKINDLKKIKLVAGHDTFLQSISL